MQEDQTTIRNLKQRLAMMEQSATLQIDALKSQLQQKNAPGGGGICDVSQDYGATMLVK